MRLLSTIISILTVFSLSAKAQNHDSEHVILNEISMWNGHEYDYSNADAAKSLPTIRQLLLEGRNDEAQKVMYERFVPKKSTEGGGHIRNHIYPNNTETSEYARSLDLSTATAHASFRKGGADAEGQKTSPYLEIRDADKNYRPKSLR